MKVSALRQQPCHLEAKVQRSACPLLQDFPTLSHLTACFRLDTRKSFGQVLEVRRYPVIKLEGDHEVYFSSPWSYLDLNAGGHRQLCILSDPGGTPVADE